MQQLYLIFLAILLFSSAVYAQERVVNGVVTEADGSTLPGVSIQLKGTSQGTVTGIDGSYSIRLQGDSDVLIFSYIGFETVEVSVGNRSQVDVQLVVSMKQLQEVVVTALGIRREKKALGYAAQEVKGNDLVIAGENNVLSTLSGRVAGVQINQAGTGPGGTSKVVVRGYASIAGSNSPLFVIDGVPMNNPQGGGGQFGGLDFGDGISNLNPDDIESINVLKGASATALYGSRGQNGVIMITTKRGESRKGIGVEFNSNVAFENPMVLPDFQNRFGRGSNGNFPVDAQGNFSNATRVSWGARALGQTEVNGTPLLNWTGQPTPYTVDPNNISDFFRTGHTINNSIGFSGGNEQTQARVSLAHFRKESIMPNSHIDRINLNLIVNTKLSEKLSLEGKVNYIRQEAFNRPNLTLNPDNPMNSLIQMPRSINLDDLREFRDANGRPRVFTNATGTDQWQNPFWAVFLNTNNDDRDRVIGFMKLEYAFNDWLKMHIRTGTDFYNDFRQNRNATNTIFRITPDRSFYSQFYGRVEERNTDLLLMATKDLSAKINLSGNLGGNLLDIKTRSLNTQAQGLNIPDFFVIQNALSTLTTESASHKQINSVFGSVQAAYNNYLFVEFAARNDWSSSLPVNAWSYFYPSVSTSWVFTDMGDRNWGKVDFGKLRLAYAQVGNDTGPHQLDQNFVVNALSHGGQSFGQIVGVQPPVNLKPERTTSLEAGLDASFFKSRLTVDFTYYYAGTRNQILQVPVSRASGFNSSLINAGLITNQGFELSVRGRIIETKNFGYEATVNFTRNRSRVVELAPNVEVYQLGADYDQFGVRIQAEVGGEFGDIYADRAFLRDPVTGQRIIGENGLPIPDPAGIRRIGNFQPDFLAGVLNNFRYKNFFATLLFDIRGGGDIFSFSNAVAAANGNARFTQFDRLQWYAGAGGLIAQGVNPDGQPNQIEVNPQTYWQFVGGRASAFAEEFLYDGSFIMLRELSVGFNLPKAWLQEKFIRTARVSAVGRNLFFLHKNTPGFSPEATFNAGNDQGIEAFAFPATRSIGFNLNLTF
jgi:TonB-linked SusC/RagA family outer membrane protein